MQKKENDKILQIITESLRRKIGIPADTPAPNSQTSITDSIKFDPFSIDPSVLNM